MRSLVRWLRDTTVKTDEYTYEYETFKEFTALHAELETIIWKNLKRSLSTYLPKGKSVMPYLKGSNKVCSPKNSSDIGFTSSPGFICPLHQQASRNRWTESLLLWFICIVPLLSVVMENTIFLPPCSSFIHIWKLLPSFSSIFSCLDKTKNKQKPNKQITICCFLHYPSLLSLTALCKT